MLFKEIALSQSYIDKTLLIRDVVDRKSKVTLFTRPDGFGKSTNMDMLRLFFEKADYDTSKYFRNKAIWNCGMKYRRLQGQYPVIFISLHNVRSDFWYEDITNVIKQEYWRHKELLDCRFLMNYDYYERITSGKFSVIDIKSSLFILSSLLAELHRKKVFIIIDGYDYPFCYDTLDNKCSGFVQQMLSAVLKDNPHIEMGFLSGIFHFAELEKLSGSNFVSYSVFDDMYSSYFGFTIDEIDSMFRRCDVTAKPSEIIDLCGGYRFGNTCLVKPDLISSFFLCRENKNQHTDYSIGIENNILKNVDSRFIGSLKNIFEKDCSKVFLCKDVINSPGEILSNYPKLLNFFVCIGYLQFDEIHNDETGFVIGEVKIPNKTIHEIWKRLLADL